MCVYHTVVVVPGDRFRSYRGNLTCWCPLYEYHLRFSETEFCVISSLALWWRSVEVQRGSVPELTLL